MFCPNCGTKIVAEGNFCEHCGYSFSKEAGLSEEKDINKELLLAINLSRTQTLFFYPYFLVYKGQRINYTDIEGISYLCTKTTHSVNFIPLEKSSRYSIQIQVAGKINKIEFSAESFSLIKSKSEKEKDEIFAKFIYIIEKLIKPFILTNLLLKFLQEKQVKLPNLTITPSGLCRKGLLGREEFLPWEQYYNAILKEGFLHIYKVDGERKYREYFKCSTEVINSVILPEFLNFLFAKKGILDNNDQQKLIQLKKEREEKVKNINFVNEKGFCWSCASPIESDQKFCSYCGSKLL